MRNEKGITLIELLVAIVVASLVMGVIYSVILIVFNYYDVETSKTKLQQEANYIITELQKIHRAGDCYLLSITENEVAVGEDCSMDNKRVLSNKYNYSSKISYINSAIYPKSRDVDLTNLTIQDKMNDNLYVEISSVLTRLKSN